MITNFKTKNEMKKSKILTIIIFFLIWTVSGCAQNQYKPKLFNDLPEWCNTPDAMAFQPEENTIFLSVPNFNDTRYPGIVMKVDIDGNYEPYFPAPVHPETGKGAPMGLEFGPDGNLYYADNQYFFNTEYKSRVMRIIIENGKPVRCESVIENLKLANAVRWLDDFLYVSDTFFDIGDPSKEGWGGIYRVSLDEMNNGSVKLIPDKTQDDPHLVVKAKCTPNHRGDNAGFDGMTFDKDNNLYTGNFGDGKFYKISFDGLNGKVKDFKIIDSSLTCIDGMDYDPVRNVIYIADSEMNAIQVWDIEKEKMSALWENEDTDGSNGLLDQPCEPIVIGNKIIIANFDMPFPGLKNSAFDAPYTLSVIELK